MKLEAQFCYIIRFDSHRATREERPMILRWL
jgi:hypothetical protein